MKSLRRFLAAALLTFVLTAAALADDGIIHGDRTQPTPTPTPMIDPMTSEPQPLITTTDGSGDVSNTTDAVAEVALRVLGEMFAIY
jgi:hypothetical protein